MAALGRSRLSLCRTNFCSRLCSRHVCKDERHYAHKLQSRNLQYRTKLVDQSSSFYNRQVENRLQKLCSRFYSSNGNDKNQSPENTSAYQGKEKDSKDSLEATNENVTELKDHVPTELKAGEASTQTKDDKVIELNTEVLEQQSEYAETPSIQEDLKDNEPNELNPVEAKEESDFMETSSVGEDLKSSNEQNLSVSHKSVSDTEINQDLKSSHETEPSNEVVSGQEIEAINKELEDKVSSEAVERVETNIEPELRNEELNERLSATDNVVKTLGNSKEKDLGDLPVHSKEKDNVLADTILKPDTREVIRPSNEKTEISMEHVSADIKVTTEEENKQIVFKEEGHTTEITDDKSKDVVSIINNKMEPKVVESKPVERLEEYIENEVKVEFEDESDVLYKKIDLLIKSIDKEVLNSYLMFLQMAALGLEINFQTKPRPKVWIQRYSVRKSVHVYKKHYRQYERRTYIQPCTIHKITGSTASVYLEYIQRNLPEGVAMEVTKHQIDVFPDHLKPIIKEAESSEV